MGLQKGDILISIRAPVGPTNIANDKCCIGRGLAAIRANINRNLLLFLLKYNSSAIEKKGSGSTFQSISGKELSNFEIIFPDNEKEQKKIAKLIKLKQNQIKIIEENITQKLSAISLLPSSILNEVFGKYEIPKGIENGE